MSGNYRTSQRFGVIEEVTAGTTPGTALQLMNVEAMPNIERTRETVQFDPVTSGDLRNYPTIIVGEDGAVSVPSTAVQFRNLFEFYEGLMGSDEVSVAAISETDISVTSDVMTSVGGAAFTNLADGDCFHIAFGGGGPTDGVYGPISSAAAGSITFPAGQIANYSAGSPQVHKAFTRLVDGTTLKTYSAEWEATGLSTHFENCLYAVVNSGSWAWAKGSKATEEFALMAQTPDDDATATIGTGGATAAPTSAPMNASGNFGSLWIGRTATNLAASAVVPSLGLGLARENAPGYGVGSTGFSDNCLGKLTGTLDVEMLLDDNTEPIVTNFGAHDTLWARWDVSDPDGNRIVYMLPALKPDTRSKGENNNRLANSYTFSSHDPAKDTDSTFTSAGFGYQAAFFFIAV